MSDLHVFATACLCALAVSLSLPAFAQKASASQHRPAPFSMLDANTDGFVTDQEFNAFHTSRPGRGAAGLRFGDLDLNGDGKLTEAELTEARNARMLQRRGGMEPGGDMGAGRMAPVFGDFDADGNGRITEEELWGGRANRMSERAQQGYLLRNAGNAPDFKMIDANGDGLIDPQEFATMQARHREQMMPGHGQGVPSVKQ